MGSLLLDIANTFRFWAVRKLLVLLLCVYFPEKLVTCSKSFENCTSIDQKLNTDLTKGIKSWKFLIFSRKSWKIKNFNVTQSLNDNIWLKINLLF